MYQTIALGLVTTVQTGRLCLDNTQSAVPVPPSSSTGQPQPHSQAPNKSQGMGLGQSVTIIHNGLTAIPFSCFSWQIIFHLPSCRDMYLRNSSRKMTGREKQSTVNHSVQFRGVIWKTVCYDGKEGGACARGVWVGPCSVHCTWQSHAFLHCVALVSGRSYMQCRTCSLPLKVMATSWLLFLCLVISKKSCWWTLA